MLLFELQIKFDEFTWALNTSQQYNFYQFYLIINTQELPTFKTQTGSMGYSSSISLFALLGPVISSVYYHSKSALLPILSSFFDSVFLSLYFSKCYSSQPPHGSDNESLILGILFHTHSKKHILIWEIKTLESLDGCLEIVKPWWSKWLFYFEKP